MAESPNPRSGTGTDTNPHRIFNPTVQAHRFDPDGDYVRRYVPELRSVPAHRILEPWRMSDAEQRGAGCRIGRDYPAPLVDHRERRVLTLERYRRSREAAG